METAEKTKITIQTTVNAPIEKAWKVWTSPDDIIKWSTPSPEWHTPRAEHELKSGGRFVYRMEARDGSMGFDFGGTYNIVKPNEQLSYTMDDGRTADIKFSQTGGRTKIVEVFEAENQNPVEMQRAGWQAIMDSFMNYVESN